MQAPRHIPEDLPNPRGRVLDTYAPPLLTVAAASGCTITDEQGGVQYLDMTSGIGVTDLGHCHPRIVQAIAEQAAQYAHVSNLFAHAPQRKLADTLCSISDMEGAFFTNSGTEAVEAAIKLVRQWGKDTKKETMIGFSGAFHGRSTGALSLIDKPAYTDAFRPLLPATMHLRYNCCDSLDTLPATTAAVFIEYLQGEGGLQSATPTFAKKLEEKRREIGFLLVADEIQSGMGRTGKFFAYQHYGVQPDVVLMSKALGGGLPLGAVLARGEAAKVFKPGDHGTTFGGNPVCCAAGNMTIQIMLEQHLIEKAAVDGTYLANRLRDIQGELPGLVNDVRGKGLMCGLALSCPAQPFADLLRTQHRILVNVTAGNVLRLLPPFIISREQIDIFLLALKRVLSEHVG